MCSGDVGRGGMLTIIDVISAVRDISDRARQNYQAIEQHYNIYDMDLCQPASFEPMSVLMNVAGYSGRLGQCSAYQVACVYYDIQRAVRCLAINKIFAAGEVLSRCYDASLARPRIECCKTALPIPVESVFLPSIIKMNSQLEYLLSMLREADSLLTDATAVLNIKQLFDCFCSDLILKKYPESLVHDAISCSLALHAKQVGRTSEMSDIDLEQLLSWECRFDECTSGDIFDSLHRPAWSKRRARLIDFLVGLNNVELLELFAARYSAKVCPSLRKDAGVIAVNSREYLSIWSTELRECHGLRGMISARAMTSRAIK